MRKFMYLSLIEKLKEWRDENGQPVIRHFDLWNDNMEYIRENEAFFTPAVFVEFGTITWGHQGEGVREAALTITLHIITERNMPTSHELPYEQEALRFFDLLTGVNRCLHGHAKTGGVFSHDALTSLQSITDHDFDELQHNREIYTCHILDGSAAPVLRTIKAAVKINV
jgi:hypothetical protein